MSMRGHVIAASVVWNRGVAELGPALGVAPEMAHALVTESIPSYAPESHDHWGIWPLVMDVGHPEHFPEYPGPKIKLLT